MGRSWNVALAGSVYLQCIMFANLRSMLGNLPAEDRGPESIETLEMVQLFPHRV
jgi:hypothetical protein